MHDVLLGVDQKQKEQGQQLDDVKHKQAQQGTQLDRIEQLVSAGGMRAPGDLAELEKMSSGCQREYHRCQMVKHERLNRELKEQEQDEKYERKLADLSQAERDQLERLLKLKRDNTNEMKEAKSAVKRRKVEDALESAWGVYDSTACAFKNQKESVDTAANRVEAARKEEKKACSVTLRTAKKEMDKLAKEKARVGQAFVKAKDAMLRVDPHYKLKPDCS